MSEKDPRPVCLTIAGVDPSGGAGVLADIKTFSHHDCFGTGAITSLTFQNTTGVFGAATQSAEVVYKQIKAVAEDMEIAAVKTGMLPTLEVIDAVAESIGEFRLPNVVVDPVVRATSGFDLIDDQALSALVENLFPLSTVITPNLAEAERIVGCAIRSLEDLANAGRKMRALGAGAVLIKGGHSFEQVTKRAVDRLFLENGMREFDAPFIDGEPVHGTGCALSSAIAANLAHGKTLIDAIADAKDFVSRGIQNARMVGQGNRPVNV
ncbi:MAG: phosphomethylpyrimidine kinase [Acidobacteria bacterium OLB17]|nr:MAG: phosphomethylpyrimidine kinase [Acidobacteria bacterium OLB17]MCZ2390023.1 bifunctional hydroxymethylpyrimidine kinase/phosphomethylpyrimidine kinase [Acidobacteriota bacterium]